MGKWLQLLKEIAPGVTRVTVIFNPDTAPYATLLNPAIEAAAPSFGMAVTLSPVHDDLGIEEAIAAQAREPGGGLIAFPDSFNVAHRNVLITTAARHGLPGIGTPVFPVRNEQPDEWCCGVAERHRRARLGVHQLISW
jgi:putative ABC transport system substrate-binding protein